MSGAYVAYHQRQNKAVDRQLFIDILQKLNRRIPISDSIYVGFGGAFLEDFKLIHTVFGVKKMISLEINEAAYKRQQFNLPLACIECLNIPSGDFVSDFRNLIEAHAPRAKNNVIWLDYAKAGATALREQLMEFEALLGKMAEGDILKITLNASPRPLFENEFDAEGRRLSVDAMKQRRSEALYNALGEDYLGVEILPEAVSINNYPKTLSAALQRASARAFLGRDIIFQPLGTFLYADSEHKMLTLTGIIVKEKEKNKLLKEIGLKDLKLASAIWGNITEIKLPALTPREKLFIDRHLPKYSAKSIHKKLGFLFDHREVESQKILENYIKFYRQYPNFQRVVF